MKKKIAIIGSGIAGLTSANLFNTNPLFDVKVYEREKELSLEEGYGIQLAPNSISILNKIKFSSIESNIFYNPLKINFYSNDSTKICDLDLERFNTDKHKYTTLKRSSLIEFLKTDLFLNNIKFGKEVKKVTKINDKLLINFSDNTNDLVDYLIVSDGVFSNTKSVVENKNTHPIYNGSIAIRTLIKKTQDFPYENKNISLIMLKNAHIVIYPINKKGELNLVCILRKKLSNRIDLNSLIEKEILSQNKNFKNLFKNSLESWPIYVTKKPYKSTYENLFYLGDAFYTFPPTMAQGASQSIEAAYELFNLLSKDTKDLQNLYFKKRLERVRMVNNRSMLNYYSFHLSNPLMIKARNYFLKKVTKNEKFLNSYLGNIYQGV
ncbi:MAG: salicylate 1-monooxygenase [Candidatus Marinimicrobia bacterium]|nr:salicylate 1-monooxygenase [Candidatus Neomarinimicrobiota bacterium]RPG05405.1 MAG: salicylate 1-monooxygenase [Pelagibacteraceae bacterium TMED247]